MARIMQIDKNMILDLLRQKGQDSQAEAADKELPQKVDTDNQSHLDMLKRFGIDPQQLTGLLDKLPGGVGDKIQGGLGKLL
jgi:hypothetical protein